MATIARLELVLAMAVFDKVIHQPTLSMGSHLGQWLAQMPSPFDRSFFFVLHTCCALCHRYLKRSFCAPSQKVGSSNAIRLVQGKSTCVREPSPHIILCMLGVGQQVEEHRWLVQQAVERR